MMFELPVVDILFKLSDGSPQGVSFSAFEAMTLAVHIENLQAVVVSNMLGTSAQERTDELERELKRLDEIAKRLDGLGGPAEVD